MRDPLEMPERRAIWLYSYEKIKRRGRMDWQFDTWVHFPCFIAVPFAISMCQLSNSGLIVRAIALFFPLAMAGIAVIEFPAALIYFYRKSRGIPVDIWDCETPNDPAVREEHSHHK